jgi:hypothetical protein
VTTRLSPTREAYPGELRTSEFSTDYSIIWRKTSGSSAAFSTLEKIRCTPLTKSRQSRCIYLKRFQNWGEN